MSHELIQPFQIDDGELNGLTPQECFSLGVEWKTFLLRIQSGQPFTDYVLESNAERLEQLAERCGRFVERRLPENGWSLITVGGDL